MSVLSCKTNHIIYGLLNAPSRSLQLSETFTPQKIQHMLARTQLTDKMEIKSGLEFSLS